MILPLAHQIKKSKECFDILKVKGYVYLAGKPRSGKTYTAIMTAERSKKIANVLVLTPKGAIPGWLKFTENNEFIQHNYYVTNYEQVGRFVEQTINGKTRKVPLLKLNAKNYGMVIIDESHNLGTLGKPSNRIKLIKLLCKDLPHIHLSGTAIVESPNSIYHQMAISKFTPFPHRNFYDFFREYGEPYYIQVAGRDMQQYDKANLDKLMPVINEFTVYMTQEDAGIPVELQAVDKVHYVELMPETKELYNRLQRDKVVTVWPDMFISFEDTPELNNKYRRKRVGEVEDLVCDTEMKLRTTLHMLESGVVKIEDTYMELGNTEKIDYIRRTFGDTSELGIMCHFVGERDLLRKHFRNANIYSSTSHAEGVDLSHLKYFVIMSSGYSGSKFIQRRDRVVNVNGSNTLTVHHILVKNAISEQVYKKTSKKEDFNNSTYEKTSL